MAPIAALVAIIAETNTILSDELGWWCLFLFFVAVIANLLFPLVQELILYLILPMKWARRES
jgi:hypothetical protein